MSVMRETEDARHDTLWQRACELADELDLGVVDPFVEQVVRVSGDHVAVPECARPDPRIGEFLAVPVVELLGRAQRQHRCVHQVVMGCVGLLGRESLVGELTESLRGQAEEPFGVSDHTRHVGVLGEDECIGPGREAAALDPQDRGVAMEDLVGLVPVLLGAVAEEVDVVELTGHAIGLSSWLTCLGYDMLETPRSGDPLDPLNFRPIRFGPSR